MPRTPSGGERFELLVAVGAAQREHGINSRDLLVFFGAFDTAILDRLPHHSELVTIQSDSYRPRKKDDPEPCRFQSGRRIRGRELVDLKNFRWQAANNLFSSHPSPYIYVVTIVRSEI